jgi:hypothetical protein
MKIVAIPSSMESDLNTRRHRSDTGRCLLRKSETSMQTATIQTNLIEAGDLEGALREHLDVFARWGFDAHFSVGIPDELAE